MSDLVASAERRATSSVQDRASAVLRAVCDLGALGGLVVILGLRIAGIWPLPGRVFVILAAAVALLVLRRLTRWIGVGVTLAVLSFMCATALGAVGLKLAGVDVTSRLVFLSRPFRFRPTIRVPQVYQLDDRYGHSLRPGSVGELLASPLHVTYTIDATGHRVTPSPAAPTATLLIIGDSFTFGTSVGDTEPFPSVLGELWPTVHVINGGVPGWGITQFHLALRDALAQPVPPDAVLVALIPNDLERTYLRNYWTKGQKRRLEFIDGEFVSRSDDGRPIMKPTAEVLHREALVARDNVEAMIQAARATRVPLGFLLLPSVARPVPFPPELTTALRDSGVPMLDLRGFDYLPRAPRDFHPSVAGHRRIAHAIADSPLAALLEHRAAAATTRPATGKR